MNEIVLELTEEEFSRLGQMVCANAALEICRIHFRRVDRNVTFLVAGKGADLRVRFQDGVELDLEVKGTESVGIAWTQFKVSSQQSYDLLAKGMPVYRVTGIGSRTITIFIMKYGVDFAMSPYAYSRGRCTSLGERYGASQRCAEVLRRCPLRCRLANRPW